MIKHTRFFIILCAFLISTSGFSSDFHLPERLSPEAKKVLSKFSRAFLQSQQFPQKDDQEGWQRLKERYIAYVTPLNKSVVAKFKPQIIEDKIAGVPVLHIHPQSADKQDKRLLIYLHGGAYTLFDSRSSLYNIVPLAHEAGLNTISIDYTTAPQKKEAAIIDEVVTVIEHLYNNGYNAKSIGIIGDSAGGGLAVSALLKLRDKGQIMPNTLALWSPWVDLTPTGASYHMLKHSEPSFLYEGLLKHAALAYAGSKKLTDPLLSPVYADFSKGFPRTLIQGGTKELLLSDFVRLYQKIDQAKNKVTLDLYDGMWHVFQSHHHLPESKVAILKTAHFLRQHIKVE